MEASIVPDVDANWYKYYRQRVNDGIKQGTAVNSYAADGVFLPSRLTMPALTAISKNHCAGSKNFKANLCTFGSGENYGDFKN